uniref:Putative glycosyltransferase n=1 Tax=viral metagenome TaxID=1070528 RepID=A0A6M3KZC8_9ZZZZ
MLPVSGEGVQIGMPVVGDLPDEGFYSLISLIKPPGTKFNKVTNLPVDIARNQMVNQLEREWLFMFDADEIIPPQALVRLLSWNLPIVSGVVFLSNIDRPAPAIYKYEHRKQGRHYYSSKMTEVEDYLNKHKDEQGKELGVVLPATRDELIECDAVGTGCLLIHRSVFEAIRPPYFVLNSGGRVSGEDFSFCRKAKRAGFKIYADPGVLCGHKPKQLIGYQYFLSWLKASKETGG